MSAPFTQASTHSYDVYYSVDRNGAERYYFEHKMLGDTKCAVAIVEMVAGKKEVTDLDMCYALSKEQADFLRERGIDTSGAEI